MLRHLYIQNFVLIDEVNLDFENGFSAFTGETGAGKSIFMDAIGLLRGDKSNQSFIMKGKDKAIIEGTFDISTDEHAKCVLQEAGFDTEDDITFTRELLSSGKSVARIEHRVVSLNLLKDVLMNQIDIHGQRDNAYLLNTKNHLHLLDAYCNTKDLVQKVNDCFRIYADLLQQKQTALNDTFNENDLAYYKYQINEITAAKLTIGEDEELEAKEKQYQSIKDSLDKFHTIREIYDEHLSSDLYTILKTINSLKPSTIIESLQNNFSDAYYNLTDAIEELLKYQETMDMDEDDVNAMEERLYEIQKLKRKYGRTIQNIFDKKEEFEQKVLMFEHRQEYLLDLDKKIQKAYAQFQQFADELHQIRIIKAKQLDQDIQRHLQDLLLPNARFFTNIQDCEANINGIDDVEFMISMNKGEDLKPLVKTASGGELSRLMLGLKVIFTRLQGIDTVIFDEIDTGVSGQVAIAIGKQMQKLAKDCQVFSITHLAPVAASAINHYLVSKGDINNTTRTTITLLQQEDRIKELATISFGEVTKASLSSSEELYQRMQANV